MIDANFSLFDIASQWNVQRLFAEYRGALKTISDQIENTVITSGVYTRIFSGFQRFSYFLPRLEQYRELARVADGIWVFGIPDVELPIVPGVNYVPLAESDRLVSEWFLVVDSPEYFTALTAQDLSGFDVPIASRRFRGVWTFEDNLVNHLQVKLSEALGLPPLTIVERLPRDYRFQLRQLAESTGHLVAMLERRNQELDQARELQEDLSYMLVHDLQSPLTAMIGNLSLLVLEDFEFPEEKKKEIIKRSIEGGNKLKGMMADLLDLAKLEEGYLKVKHIKLEPGNLLRQTMQLIGERTDAKRVKFDLVIPDQLPYILGEADKLSRVIDNLLTNALKYAREKIIVSAYPESGYVVFSVQDDGPGIPQEAREQIFEKFVQLEGRKQQLGTGLGLSFCKLMVEAHGGRIWVEGELGKGSNFIFNIPAYVD